ncbi:MULTISPECIES: hypothetical protein [Bacillus]|uniref:hypothetical protein n=1 Tax=Bacillus TaxID=1386 RepID=UPI00094C83B0|nr:MULTISPECIES: hypothetical protein [Bacillus]MEC0902422.1 hypothetical protein [Bacillus anthracis]
MRIGIKYFLFFSSFSPLFFILLIRNFELEEKITYELIINQFTKNYFLNTVMLIFSTIPILFLCVLIKNREKSIGNEYRVKEIKSKNNEVLNYIATYLIPFATFSTNKINEIISLYLLLIILAIVYVEANSFFMNPVLILLGYKIVEVVTEQGKNIVVISRKYDHENSGKLILVTIFKDLYLEVKRR